VEKVAEDVKVEPTPEPQTETTDAPLKEEKEVVS